MPAKEIITLQIGHYANFVGTHWWNIQESSFEYGETKEEKGEEIDHDVLFREGITNRGQVTYTPRLVLTELKGGLRSLTTEGLLYDSGIDTDYTSAWHGKTCMHKQTEDVKNEFLRDLEQQDSHKPKSVVNGKSTQTNEYNLEDDVRVWSDYLRTFLHPKSTVIVNDYYHNSSGNPFDLWTKGTCLKGITEEIEERVRFYAEDCDMLQGFHVVIDSDNGFSGISSSLMPYLKDEFSSKSILSFPVTPSKYQDDNISKQKMRGLNSALLLPTLTNSCSIMFPLSLAPDNGGEKYFPSLLYDINLNYHTSAILASALDTLTLNYRLKGALSSDLDGFQVKLTAGSRNLVCTSLMLPFPFQSHNEKLVQECFMGPLPATALTPNLCSKSQSSIACYSSHITLRGVDRHKKLPQRLGGHRPHFQDITNLNDSICNYQMKYFPGAITSFHVMSNLMKTAVPFPQFFVGNSPRLLNGHATNSKNQHHNGDHMTNGSAQAYTNGHHGPAKVLPHSVPVLTSLECSSKAVGIYDTATKSLNVGQGKCAAYGLEMDDVESHIEYLLTMRDEYKPDGVCNSDSEEDF